MSSRGFKQSRLGSITCRSSEHEFAILPRCSLITVHSANSIYATCTSPVMHPICLPKFCITFVFHLSWVLQPSQEKLKTMLMQSFFWGGGEGEGREWGKANKVLYGRCASGVFMYFLNIFFFFQSRVATQERRSISLPLYMDLVHGPHIHAIATRPFVSGDVGRAKAHVPAWVSTLIALKGQENST